MAEYPIAAVLPGYIEPCRALARRGVPVVAISQGPDLPLRRSRSIREVRPAPDSWDATFTSWFESRSSIPEGAVVIPTKDAALWWHSSRGKSATLPLAVVREILVKYRLYERCLAAGLRAPRTWLIEPASPLPAGRFPMMLKPQTRVGLQHWTRGRLVRDTRELAAAVEWFRREIRYADYILADEPLLAHPMVQEYVERPHHEVYHLAGYRSRSGESVVAAHRKLLQYPLRFGSGLCFESAEVDHALAGQLEGLLAGAGYHGIFEAEFVERDGEKLLIDLNPRAYNGVSLEVARGYNLPWFHYLETLGETALLSRELASARNLRPPALAWRDGMRFWTMVAAQSVSGGMSPRQAAGWVRWSLRHRGRMVDPYFARGDVRAGVTGLAQHLGSAVTGPRAFLGTYVRRGLDR